MLATPSLVRVRCSSTSTRVSCCRRDLAQLVSRLSRNGRQSDYTWRRHSSSQSPDRWPLYPIGVQGPKKAYQPGREDSRKHDLKGAAQPGQKDNKKHSLKKPAQPRQNDDRQYGLKEARQPSQRNNRAQNLKKSKVKDAAQADQKDNREQTRDEPSLMEKLFPTEAKSLSQEKRRPHRELPFLPFDQDVEFDRWRQERLSETTKFPSRTTYESQPSDQYPVSRRAQELRTDIEARMRDEGEKRSVLMLHNASPNLTERDFLRLVPRGKHMEGWTLGEGDIVKVVPGRDLETLQQRPFYYIVFASQLAAFTYQGYALRHENLMAQETPKSFESPLPPPPGYVRFGLDAHDALKRFSLVPAGQKMKLQQLSHPLAPGIELIAKHGGYPAMVLRKRKMPHELRMTLEGAQVPLHEISRHIARHGRSIAVQWDDDELLPTISRWTPVDNWSDGRRNATANFIMRKQTAQKSSEEPSGKSKDIDSVPVYILGFRTEYAAQRFQAYWHRRPLDGSDSYVPSPEFEDQLPPTVDLEKLW